MMSSKTQRDAFLLLTVIGSFLCLALIALGAFLVIEERHSIISEIATGDGNALIGRVQSNMPLSVFASSVFVGTWFSYRRYHKLTFGSP